MITFTIITCTYNAEHEVGRTLDSVLGQTYPHIEHLILDGQSADGTLALARHYRQTSAQQAEAHSVIVVSEPDRGLYDAMNKGIDRATGDYLIFLNAGDVFPSPDTLEHVAHAFADGEACPGVIYGQADIVDDEGRLLRHRRLKAPARLSWRSFRHGMLVCHQSFYASTRLAKAIRYDLRYRFSADVDWCIRIMREAERQHLPLKNVGEVLVNYLDGGMSVKNHRASLRERFMVMARHYGYLSTVMMHLWFVVRAVVKR